MQRRPPVAGEVVLGLLALAATALAVHFALRYGDVYRFGDTEFRRHGAADRLGVLLPALVATASVAGILLSRLTPFGLRRQYRDEVEALRRARAWTEQARAGAPDGPQGG